MKASRTLQTVLFTDIVGSTEEAARVGDRRWREVLRRHHEIVRRELDRFGGREVKTTGDGFLAVFDGSERAILCACAIRDAVAEAGLQVRCGLHLGKVEHHGDDVAGIGVHVGARVAALAEPGEVLASSTVREAEAGSGFAFEPRGVHALKGIPGEWRLFAVTEVPDEPEGIPGRRRRRIALPRGALAVLATVLILAAAYGVVSLIGGNGDGTPSDPDPASIAVLPFENLSADSEDEYFSEGITSEINHQLSRVRGLRVISRTSTRKYADTDRTVGEIATELGVGSVLEGAVQRVGDRVRVTAQLVDARKDSTLWSERFEPEMTDLFDVQGEIARQVARALRPRLSDADRERLAAVPTRDPVAYDLYLKGRWHWDRRTPEGIRQSARFFQRAVERDPEFARAWAGLADAYVLHGGYYLLPAEEAYPRARRAAERALAIDPELAEAHTSLAATLTDYYWEWDRAERHFRRALELEPNYVTARIWYSQFLSNQGRFEEGIEMARRAQTVDPLNLLAFADEGRAYYLARDYDRAIAHLEEALEKGEHVVAYLFLAKAYAESGRPDRAVEVFERGERTFGNHPIFRSHRGYFQGLAGNRAEAERTLTAMKEDGAAAMHLVFLQMGLGRIDRAIESIERGYENRDWRMVYLKEEPAFDPIRDDPRFRAVVEKMGFPK